METEILSDGSLSPQLKGDLYWKKLILLLRSEAEKQQQPGRKTKSNLLTRLLKKYDDKQEMPDPPNIRGNEFRDRPPTSTGRDMLMDDVLAVMRTRDRYRELLQKMQEGSLATVTLTFGVPREFDEKALSVLCRLLEETVRAFFRANGMDEKTRELLPAGKKAEAEASFQEIREVFLNRISLLREVTPPKKLVAQAVECFFRDETDRDRDQVIRFIPGYIALAHLDLNADLKGWTSMEEFRKAAEELKDYRDSHPAIFLEPTFHGVFKETIDLPVKAEVARSLRNSLAEYSKTEKMREGRPEEREELLELWVLADAMTRCSYLILEFIEIYEERSIRQMLEEGRREIYDMKYAVQEKICRKALEEVMKETVQQADRL